uniref:uncharacterized protein LOC109953686 n=1 Tax=Monopterus albus TaxID=43700 RepID=UPI0009B43E4C|nr:uncharacterized protein LOC109953686 [Monopterus albus]
MFIVIFLTKNYFKQYQAFHEGSCPSAKHRENAFSKVSRIRSFLAFMAGKDSSLATWRFLDKAEQIIQWPNVLAASGKNITTANFYLRNVLQFMIYFKETPPKLARLSQSQITGVIRAVRQAIKSISKKMLAHQLTTKDKKLSKVVSQESLRRCQVGARKAIPKLLKELREDYTVQLRNAFYGYFSAFIASIYGHHPGVFKNMTVAEVRGAATEGRPPTGYVIRVKEHKTAKDFGPAQMFLEPEEYDWLLKWLQVRERCNPPGDWVFFTPGKGPLKNLVRYMQEAWAEMGLPGKPTFIDLRTAVSAHAKNVHVPEVRSKVAKFMCHNTATTTTADRYYALHMDVEQSRAMRRHFEEASTLPHLDSPSSPPKPKKVCPRKATAQEESDSTSLSDEAVPYQEAGDSCLEEQRWELVSEEEGQEEEEGRGGGRHCAASSIYTSQDPEEGDVQINKVHNNKVHRCLQAQHGGM